MIYTGGGSIGTICISNFFSSIRYATLFGNNTCGLISTPSRPKQLSTRHAPPRLFAFSIKSTFFFFSARYIDSSMDKGLEPIIIESYFFNIGIPLLLNLQTTLLLLAINMHQTMLYQHPHV